MSTRKANDDSHFSGVPLTHKARDTIITTVWFPTVKKHSSDINVSIDASCVSLASLHHDTAQFPQACKVFNFEHVNAADNFTLISNSEFVQATPHEATAVETTVPPVAAVAAIPEAGMCGFNFDIHNIPNFTRAS
jgi:hypothetical protein